MKENANKNGYKLKAFKTFAFKNINNNVIKLILMENGFFHVTRNKEIVFKSKNQRDSVNRYMSIDY